MCCGVVPFLFSWFLRVPSLHVLVFIRKTFFNSFLEIVKRREAGEGKMHGL